MELDAYLTKATGTKNGLQLVFDAVSTDPELNGILVTMSMNTARVRLIIEGSSDENDGKMLVMRAASALSMDVDSLLEVRNAAQRHWKRLMNSLGGAAQVRQRGN